jgi:hypothetical protein
LGQPSIQGDRRWKSSQVRKILVIRNWRVWICPDWDRLLMIAHTRGISTLSSPSLLITEDIDAGMHRIFLGFATMNRSRSVTWGVQKARRPRLWDDDQKVMSTITRMGWVGYNGEPDNHWFADNRSCSRCQGSGRVRQATWG